MDRENVRWLVAGLVFIVGLVAWMSGYNQVLWLLGIAALLWIAYEIWDAIGDHKEKQSRDKTRKHKNAYLRRHH